MDLPFCTFIILWGCVLEFCRAHRSGGIFECISVQFLVDNFFMSIVRVYCISLPHVAICTRDKVLLLGVFYFLIIYACVSRRVVGSIFPPLLPDLCCVVFVVVCQYFYWC